MRSIFLCTLLMAAGMGLLRAEDTASIPSADGFQCPVGSNGSGEGYYIARGYRANGHLGDDWNGIKGGDTDMGDPVYATAHGIVVFAKNYHVGWGNVVIIRHAFHEGLSLRYVDSLYGHLADFNVREGQQVKRGQTIGHIGNNNGMYDAHLHFEIRKNINIGMYRSSFPRDGTNYYEPNQFIAAHLSCSQGGKTVSVPINTFPATAPPSYVANKVYTPVYSPGSAPATHLPPAGAGGLRTSSREVERQPPATPAPRIVTSAPTTPKPVAVSEPVVETPTTGKSSAKGSPPVVASKGTPISSESRKETSPKEAAAKESAKKESATKESTVKENTAKEATAKAAATASTKKSTTPAPTPKSGSGTVAKAATTPVPKTVAKATAKPAATPKPEKTSPVASTKPSQSTPAPARNVAAAKAATPEPVAEKAAKVEPRPSLLDVNRHEPPTPPAAAEGSPIRRSAPSFRVDRFQDLRGLGY